LRDLTQADVILSVS